MRTLGAAIATIALLSCGTVADEPAAVEDQAELSMTIDAVEASYPLKWQRRLLAAQLAFAATLNELDPVETGSINPPAQ